MEKFLSINHIHFTKQKKEKSINHIHESFQELSVWGIYAPWVIGIASTR